MTRLIKTRWFGRVMMGSATLALLFAVWSALRLRQDLLHDVRQDSGWLLLGLFLLLLGFNLRKKLSFLPLGSAYRWAQLHFYGGILTSGVFVLHLDGLPNGPFEILFAVLFSVLLLSGFAGLFVSRRLPRPLRMHSETVIFERIPALCRQVTDQAEQVMADHVLAMGQNSLSTFYQQQLLPFLASPKASWSSLLRPAAEAGRWAKQFEKLELASQPEDLEPLRQLRDLTLAKVGLDLQYSSRRLLKGWLFLHIPLSYGLLFFVLTHLVLVYGYGGISL